MFDRCDGESLRSGFLRQARMRPDAPALVVRGATYTYGQMEEHARRLASGILRVSGRGRAERVGVFGYRSETSYCSALAALLSGAAFVPLNPSFPHTKTAFMMQQAGLDALIVDKTCAQHLPAVLAEAKAVPLLLPDSDSAPAGYGAPVLGKSELDGLPPLVDLPAVIPDDTAYVLFTSGSTGNPKGVPVTNGNVTHFIDVMTPYYDIRPEDRFSQTFDQTFDLSVFDLFMAWSNGACVYSLSTVELLNPTGFVNRNGITVWFSVPSVAAHMMRRKTLAPDSMPSLRLSLFCGEPLSRAAAEAWQDAARNSVVENLYGPTEATIACLTHRWEPSNSPGLCHNDLAPIGRPFPGLGAIIVDEALKPVPEGSVGELCISGPQVTPGYWRDSVKTAERYVELETSAGQTRRFYRTGDLVFRHPNGEYAFCGRADDQIKVLGHRVELGEIEAALRGQAGVEHAVAFGWPLVSGSAQGIVAFVSGESLDSASLIEGAKSALPAYAVPSQVYVVPEMPLNSNGKVDRRSLRERLSSMPSTVSVAPSR